jgi:alpha-glutamyl/putrescinyl thymine pyrophosphorylase clade 1
MTNRDMANQLPLDLDGLRNPDLSEMKHRGGRSNALWRLRPTPVFDALWSFACERQEIFFRRLSGATPPWTADPILARYKFTNAYRASDRTSQYLIRNVIYVGDQSAQEVFFRTILFKLFNRIETWKLLLRHFGEVSYAAYSFRAFDTVLSAALATGQPIYSAAYIMPPGIGHFSSTKKHQGHLRLLERMMMDRLPDKISDARSMNEVFHLLRSYPMMGDFLAYQYAVDLNYSMMIDLSESEFVVAGPGARRGVKRCFANRGDFREADVIKSVAECQGQEFGDRGLVFRPLGERQLQLVDWQNLFCEIDKYARAFFPESNGVSTRKRIKQRFRPSSESICYWYPPKWGINGRVVPPMYRAIDQPARENETTRCSKFA